MSSSAQVDVGVDIERNIGPRLVLVLVTGTSLPPRPAGRKSLPAAFQQPEIVLRIDLKRQRMFMWNPCGARVPQKKGEGKGELLVSALLASPHTPALHAVLGGSIFSNFAAK